MNTGVKSTISIRFIEAIGDTHDVDAAERQRRVRNCQSWMTATDPKQPLATGKNVPIAASQRTFRLHLLLPS